MKLNKTILDTVLKLLLNFDDGDIEFNKSNLSLVASKNVKDTIWLSNNTVDLGLPSGTLWAKNNIGATCDNTPESWYGNYYAWGEIKSKIKYSEKNYTYKDNPKTLPLENDVAYQINKLLRIPTKELIEELVDYTTNEWVENYNGIVGLTGRVFTGKNDNSLFIPAAGCYDGKYLYDIGSYCSLWSSSLSSDDPRDAYYLRIYSDVVNPNGLHDRCNGLSVRGVSI